MLIKIRVFLLLHLFSIGHLQVIQIPLGIIYDTNSKAEIRNYVLQTIKYINNDMKNKYNIKWKFRINEINTEDSQEFISSICNQMKRGVLAIFGSMNSKTANTVISFTNSYNIPFITWSYPIITTQTVKNENENIDLINRRNYQLYMHPDLSPVLIELIKYYKWKSVFYLHDHDDALKRIESLLSFQVESNDYSTQLIIRKLDNVDNCEGLLVAIDKNVQLSGSIVMMVDLQNKEKFLKFLAKVNEMGLMKSRYHYILVTLNINELELNDFRSGGANITGFSIVDYYNHNTVKLLTEILDLKVQINQIRVIPYSIGLIIDSLMHFSTQIASIIGNNRTRNGYFGRRDVRIVDGRVLIDNYDETDCSLADSIPKPWPLADIIYNKLVSATVLDGLSGPVNLNTDGYRANYIVQIIRAAYNVPISKIGSYHHHINKIDIVEEQLFRGIAAFKNLASRKRIIVTIEDAPFYMEKNGSNGTEYEGYCVDLAHKLSEMLNFTYELRSVRDKKYGNINASGHWNGMMGELINNEADMVIAPLTISAQRERAVDFSKPFMNLGISIMIKKPTKEEPNLLAFLAPMSAEIYLCVGLAYIGVSIILLIVSRLSPLEWRVERDGDEVKLENDFTVFNTLWFSLAAFLQQGIDFAPRSVSGRLVTSVWWFFALILVSSYTANLAAFLTAARMTSPIQSAEDLAKHKGMRYGSVEGGSTKEFFRTSKVPTYSKMWSFMNSLGSEVFTKDNLEGVKKVRESNGTYAFLLESSVNEYLNERAPCDTMKVGDNLDSKGYGVGTPINSDIKDAVNLAILQLKEEGFLDELKTKWWKARSECGSTESQPSSKDASQNALDLPNFIGVFCLLIVGYSCSVLIVFFEILYKSKKDSTKNNTGFLSALRNNLGSSVYGYKKPKNKVKTQKPKVIEKKLKRPVQTPELRRRRLSTSNIHQYKVNKPHHTPV